MQRNSSLDTELIETDICSVFALKIFGSLDIYTAQDLRRPLFAAADRREITDIIIDIAELEGIDSSGIGALYATAARLRQKNGCVRLAAAQEAVLYNLRLTRFIEVVPVYETVAAAIDSCRRRGATP